VQFDFFHLDIFCSITACPNIGILGDYLCETILMVLLIMLVEVSSEAEDVEEVESVGVILVFQ
jgi:hypothetical protein